MMDNRSNSNSGPDRDREDRSRKLVSRRDEQLDEEIRSQLRKKNEESRKHMNEGTEQREME